MKTLEFINRNKKKHLLQRWMLLAIFLFGIVWNASAQSFTVKGKITDEKTNDVLMGVSIMEKGTTNGAITDLDGNFTLKLASENATLSISYLSQFCNLSNHDYLPNRSRLLCREQSSLYFSVCKVPIHP